MENNMIENAEEFVRLRTSELKEEYDRATYDEAAMAVWLDIIENHSEMKIWVVHNKTVPVEILERLSKDTDVRVRDAVARKRKIPQSTLARLAVDPDSGVRYAVACNKKTSNSVLRQMLNDEWETIVEEVSNRLNQHTT